MSIVLYGKNGARQVIKGHVDFAGMEKNGWYRNPDMIPADEPDEDKDFVETEEEQAIRQLAKDEGIKNWHNKKIDNLKKELDLAE